MLRVPFLKIHQAYELYGLRLSTGFDYEIIGFQKNVSRISIRKRLPYREPKPPKQKLTLT